jgi:elongation factor P
MKINGNEIRPGNVIEHNNSLWIAVKTQAVTPGKGPAYNQVELTNLINGSQLNARFRSSGRGRRYAFEGFSFCSPRATYRVHGHRTYEQMELQQEFVGERAAFLQDGMKVVLEMHEGRAIGISLPDQVTLTVTEADPVVKGQTAASSYKPAMLENGVRVMVPPFVTTGEKIIVERRNGLRPPRRIRASPLTPALSPREADCGLSREEDAFSSRHPGLLSPGRLGWSSTPAWGGSIICQPR